MTPHESVKSTIQESTSYEVPAYRVRLFLSVDLTGSTAFKHSKSSPLEWLKAFQQFYGTFPRKLSEFYQQIGQSAGLSNEELESGSPKLWKTVGDEILFCCKIESVHHVSVCIEAFIQTLQQFGEGIQQFNLNTKGNAWVASFPTPNSSIMPISAEDSATDSLRSGNNDLVSEEMEKQADLHPNKFDFLGKGIDSGFRISKNSSIDTLTISPGLGILLLDACQNKKLTKFERKIRLAEMQCFKGVADGNLYPVLVIDVFRNKDYEGLVNAQNNLLGVQYKQDHEELQNFLRDFLNFYNIELPKVKLYAADSTTILPKFYEEYKDKWEANKKEFIAQSTSEEKSIDDIDDNESKEILQLVKNEELIEELRENLKDQ